jgi:hypothetical protein
MDKWFLGLLNLIQPEVKMTEKFASTLPPSSFSSLLLEIHFSEFILFPNDSAGISVF